MSILATTNHPSLKDPDGDRSDLLKETAEVRMTLRFSPEAKAALDWIARERNVSIAEAIRRAISTEKFFLQLTRDKGARILVDQPGERLKEIVLV